jgi:mRNA interferase HigB
VFGRSFWLRRFGVCDLFASPNSLDAIEENLSTCHAVASASDNPRASASSSGVRATIGLSLFIEKLVQVLHPRFRLHIVNYKLRVISRKAVREFGTKHADATPSLSNWLALTRRAEWQSFTELRTDFGSADQVGRRTVFNIAGNKYRLVARVNYRTQRVFILHIMKHTEYMKGDWK